MRWFGFGFNGFGQIISHGQTVTEDGGDAANDIQVICATELNKTEHKCVHNASKQISQIRASWSRRASLHLEGDRGVFLDGYSARSSNGCCGFVEQSCGCKDALINESQLTLAFLDRIEVWDLQKEDKTPAWTLTIKPNLNSSDRPLNLPLVPEGYITSKPPLYRSLSPHLKAQSLALGPEHAILLSATGAVYTWGLGSHGQLGHGSLTSEEEPRAVEALWGMPMRAIATGDSADLYMWGWNESGQLGLPSRGIRKAKKQNSQQEAAACQDADVLPEEEKDKEVFISIQAFPALLDLNPPCEIKTVSCGSRHTAAVTTEGKLYTWGWGEYGQLGHQNLISSDEPQRVGFFEEQMLCVIDVVCGAWNTFVAVIEQEEVQKSLMTMDKDFGQHTREYQL